MAYCYVTHAVVCDLQATSDKEVSREIAPLDEKAAQCVQRHSAHSWRRALKFIRLKVSDLWCALLTRCPQQQPQRSLYWSLLALE